MGNAPRGERTRAGRIASPVRGLGDLDIRQHGAWRHVSRWPMATNAATGGDATFKTTYPSGVVIELLRRLNITAPAT